MYRLYSLKQFNNEIEEKNKSIEELNYKFSIATNAGNIGIWKWNIVDNTLEWDDKMYEIYEVNKELKVDKYQFWVDSLVGDCKILAQNKIKDAVKNKTLFNVIFKINTKSGLKHIKADGQAIYDGDKPLYMIGTNMDITELINSKLDLESQKVLLEMNLNALKFEKEKSMEALQKAKISEEEALISKQKLIILNESLTYANKTKSEFLSNMSHEIRTPLAGIIGIVDIILDEKIEPNVKENLIMVKNSANNLKNIINDILDYSKIQAGKFEIKYQKFELDKVINGIEFMFKPLLSQKGLEFNVKIDEDVENFLIGDELRINQILNNIIGNAVKFTEEGKLSLQISQLLKEKDKTIIKFIVQDTGIGIAQNVKGKIFESFSQGELSNTKKFQGTGLGLAITKNLVELMGGKIYFESYENIGTKFIFELSFEYFQDKSNDIEKIEDIENLTLKNPIKVLVAEDSKINQLVIRKILEKMGFDTIEMACDGQEAVDLFNKFHYDMIFMDIQMPNMDGLEATRIIRNKNKNIPIIALSAAVLPEDTKESLKAGMNEHVKKPIDKNELIQAIGKYFEFNEIITNKS